MSGYDLTGIDPDVIPGSSSGGGGGGGTAVLTTFAPGGTISATDVQAAILEAVSEAMPTDADLIALAAAGNSAVLAATTAAFTIAMDAKLAGIAAGAQVNDTAASVAASYGADIITNGTFTGNATGWTLGGGAVYSANSVSVINGSTVTQSVNVVSGTRYQIEWGPSVIGGTVALGAVSVAVPDVNFASLVANVTGAVNLTFTFTGAYSFDGVTCRPITLSSGVTVAGIEHRTTATRNVGIGTQSQRAMVGSTDSTALGYTAQRDLTVGDRNTAIGSSAQQVLTTGDENTAVGQFAQASLVNGGVNTGIGSGAQARLKSGINNTAVGGDSQNAPDGDSANATITAVRQTSVGAISGLGSSSQDNDITTIGYNARGIGSGATALGSGAVAAFTQSVALGMSTAATAASQVALGSRHMEMVEIAAPGAGAANSARLYAVDNGSGKTQLMVIFSSGAAVQLAIQP